MTTGTDPFGVPQDQEFNVDLSQVKTSNMPPPGTYRGRLINVEQGPNGKGNLSYTWTFVVLDGPHAGKEIKQFTVLTENALWKVAQTCEALGLGEAGQRLRFTRSQAIGRTAVLLVTEHLYEGKMRTSLDTVSADPERAVSAGVVQPPAASQAPVRTPAAAGPARGGGGLP